MKIFITGGSGFIGSNVLKRLAETDHKIRCLVRRRSKVDNLRESGVEPVIGDVTDRDSVLEGMKGCDTVINLAAVYSFWEPDDRIYRKVNTEGTRNVMECALETGVSKVVHISTAGIYGKPKDCPFTEESAVGPVRFSKYTQTKYEGDLIAWELFAKNGLPLVVVYPTAVVGPGDPKATGEYIGDLIFGRLPARVLEDSVMTFVHVRDVAEVIVRALEKEGNIGEKYLAGRFQMRFGELNRMVAELAGIKLPRMSLPGFMVRINSYLFTGLANISKKRPVWNMSVDQIRMMKQGFVVDGGKVERELGVIYTSIEDTIREMVETYR